MAVETVRHDGNTVVVQNVQKVVKSCQKICGQIRCIQTVKADTGQPASNKIVGRNAIEPLAVTFCEAFRAGGLKYERVRAVGSNDVQAAGFNRAVKRNRIAAAAHIDLVAAALDGSINGYMSTNSRSPTKPKRG